MPQIGSFALLLGLALAAYSFIAGALALYRKDDAWEKPRAAPASPAG